MAKLARVLQTDIMGDLTALAKLLQSKGRGKDTILAHITPAEAKKLKADGGRGSINPDTGLLEFDQDLAPITITGTVAPPPQVDIGAIASSPTFVPSASTRAYSQQAGAEAPLTLPTYAAPTGDLATGFKIDPQLVRSIRQTGEDIDTGFKTPEAKSPWYKRGYEALGGAGGLASLGLTAGLGLLGRQQAIAAARQGREAAAQQQTMAQPYQEAGRGMVAAASRGELTPASAQAYQAAQAQLAQGAESRGGVAAQQAATQLEAFRQQLLQTQYTYGLQVANIGDNIAMGAIRTGMQADEQVAAATQNFYASLMEFGFGRFPGQTQTPTRVGGQP